MSYFLSVGGLDIARTYGYNDAFTGTTPEQLEGYDEASPIVRAIIRQFVHHKKIIHSRSMAHQVIRAGFVDGTAVTDDDIQHAYDIAAGGGFEFEWALE